VPVENVLTIDGLIASIEAGRANPKKIADDWDYGCGVRLQRYARLIVKPDGEFNDTKCMEIADTLPPDKLAQFAGNMAGLRAYCKQIFDERQATNLNDIDPERIFTELIGR